MVSGMETVMTYTNYDYRRELMKFHNNIRYWTNGEINNPEFTPAQWYAYLKEYRGRG